MIFDGALATKVMMSFENHIEKVEKRVDTIVHAVCSIYNLAYFPAFIFLIKKLDFVVNGASPTQLDLIEKLIKTFRINIKKALNVLTPKKPGVSPREITPIKKKVVKAPIRASTEYAWKAEVKLLKTSTVGKKSFFPHTISFDVKTQKINLQAVGDDVIYSDTLVGARIRDNSKHVLEIQLEGGNKIVSFATTELLETWAKFLQTQC